MLLAIIAMATATGAQSTVRDPRQTPRLGTGAIRGRVVRADTGEPLRRVQIRIDEWSAKDQSGPASTMTDAQGRYELTQLPAGTYLLKAARGGYVEMGYGQRRPFERGRPIEVAEGAVLEHIDFAMALGGVVTGRVVDEMGEPVAQASVSLWSARAGPRRTIAGSFGFLVCRLAST
jgi:protocatechuate 3,4-dioxygenase beta subunit